MTKPPAGQSETATPALERTLRPVRGHDEDALLAQRNRMSRERTLARPVSLVGFMGAGKSTIGALLAERLGRPFFDTDILIQERTGASVQELFASGREREFRDLEASLILELVAVEGAVIAVGGGATQREETRRSLRDKSLVIHLHVSWAEVREALPQLRWRPLLQRPLAEIHELYLDRQRSYRDAHVRIHATREDVEGTLRRVLRALEVTLPADRDQKARSDVGGA